MSDPDIITIAEAAKILRIGERTAYHLARNSQPAGAIKVGNQWCIDREVLIGWFKSEATKPVPPKCGEQAWAVLNALLEKCAIDGLIHVEDMGVWRVQPLSDFGTPVQWVKHFGGKKGNLSAVRELKAARYAPVGGAA